MITKIKIKTVVLRPGKKETGSQKIPKFILSKEYTNSFAIFSNRKAGHKTKTYTQNILILSGQLK
jgi:hypothetical protein